MATNVVNPGGGNPPNNQDQSISLLSKVPFGAIVGGPLKAAVEAQAAAAVACADFIQKVGFNSDNSIKVITFTFQRAGGPGSPPPGPETFSVTVPLLSIMPLPFIRIESLTANFKVAISAVDERTDTERNAMDAEGKLEGSVGVAMWKVGVSGSVSSKKDSTATNTSKYSVEQTMDISLHAVQDDMPAGLAKVLDLLNDEIKVTRIS
jgi:hypothetical protein